MGIKRLFILVAFLLIPRLGNAQVTHVLTACDVATVNSWVKIGGSNTGTVNPGDTIQLPAGDCIWNGSGVEMQLDVILSGSPGCQTTITGRVGPTGVGPFDDNLTNVCPTRVYDYTTGQVNHPFKLTCVNGGTHHRITQIQFNTNSAGRGNNPNGILILDCSNTNGTTVRFDHNWLNNLHGAPLRTQDVAGIVDHNTCTTITGRKCFDIYDPSWNDLGSFGDQSWYSPLTIGTAGVRDVLVIEDNDMGIQSCGDGYRGTRVVYRFNVFKKCHVTLHGTESSLRNRGSFWAEVYRNVFSAPSEEEGASQNLFVNMRSGSGLTFQNQGTDMPAISYSMRLNNDRPTAYWLPYGAADGNTVATATNPVDTWDIANPSGPFDPRSGTNTSPPANCTITECTVVAYDRDDRKITIDGSNWATDRWKGYTIRKSDCTDLQGKTHPPCYAVVSENDATTMTFGTANGFNCLPNPDYPAIPPKSWCWLQFTAGDKFSMYKVTQVMDGLGRTGGSLVTGDDDHPEVLPPGTWNDQTTYPIYSWLNTNNSATNFVAIQAAPANTAGANENEHFYNACANFNGTPSTSSTGPGCGMGYSNTITEAPGYPSCPVNGAAWWAKTEGSWNSGVFTDPAYTVFPYDSYMPATLGEQGRMYTCQSGTWTLFYTPLPYPYSALNPVTHVTVETAANGSGTIVAPATVASLSGPGATMYCIQRNDAGTFLANAACSWSVFVIDGGVADSDLNIAVDLKSATFSPHVAGSGYVKANDVDLNTGNAGLITVTAGGAASTSVETQADGLGVVVPAQNVTSGVSIYVFAISRDALGGLIGNVAATWSLQSKTGGVVDGNLVAAADGKSATFTAATAGTAIIRAVANTFTGNSGVITVPGGPPVMPFNPALIMLRRSAP